MAVSSIDSSNKRCLSLSLVDGNESLLLLSNVVTEASASHPKKALKSIAGSAAGSQTSQPVATTGSQKVMKISQATAFIESKNLMVGLLDSHYISPKDSAAKSCHEMTSFVHKDDYLLPAQKMHLIMLFVQNVAYADCLWGFIGELANPYDPNASPEQLDGVCSYYSTLLEIPI